MPLVFVLLLAAAPASGDVYTRKQSVDARLEGLNAKIAAARQRARELTAEIAGVSSQIQGLEARVGDVSARLATLENDLGLHRRKLARLTELFRVETRRWRFLRREYELAVERLDLRILRIYESGDASTLEIVLSARSLSEILDDVDYVHELHRQDALIAQDVRRARDDARRQREQTKRARSRVAAEARAVAVRAAQVSAVRERLLASQHHLASARSQKRATLASVKAAEREEVGEAAALERVSAQLTAQIRAAQARDAAASAASAGSSTPSASGFIWPVNGPVTSPFGMRWGRMHEGIDIGAGYGTPIHAAAAGTVIYSGWMSGYGNLVFIDHGGGISTGYAHQSSIAAANGAHVAQGQVIGYVGCTGHCFGPHLHFEVRVNGTPVDPLGYL